MVFLNSIGRGKRLGSSDVDPAVQRIRDRIQPGQRYAMEFNWDGQDTGHIVVLERPRKGGGNNIIVIDPQTGTKRTIERYMGKKIDLRTLAIYRIDHLELNPGTVSDLMRARPR